MDFWCSILEVVRNDQILDIFKGKPWVWDTRQREEWRMMAGSLARATGGGRLEEEKAWGEIRRSVLDMCSFSFKIAFY